MIDGFARTLTLSLKVNTKHTTVLGNQRRGDAQLKPVGSVVIGKVRHGSISRRLENAAGITDVIPFCNTTENAESSALSCVRNHRPLTVLLAEWTGLEPATPGVTGRYSNQLNYHSNTT